MMLFSGRSRNFRTTGFFRSYFILGILVLSLVFFVYSYWMTKRLERETAQSSMMLANLAALLPSITDKETSDAFGTILERLKLPYAVTDAAGNVIRVRGIGHGLREKILTNTMTPKDERKLAKIIEKMDKTHTPLPMEGVGVTGEEGRVLKGRVYCDKKDLLLHKDSKIVLTSVYENKKGEELEEPIFWMNVEGVEQNAELSDFSLSIIQSFIRDIREALTKGFSADIQFNPSYEKAFLHYGNTPLISQLRWWMPLAQITMVAVFLVVGFMGYQRIKHNEQQAIWAGLAKETAHQLGTPISSLMGWLEILEERDGGGDVNSIYKEMQGDVLRLRDITARFGEVGSLPKREPLDVSEVVHQAVVYFQKRLPHRQRHVEIIESHDSVPEVEANENLLQWVIENLIKNSLDAIDKDDGRIQIGTRYDPKKREVLITYKDNGKGILRKDRSKVFIPGYSSKKHGWGLGLAIVKRIIEGYHGGSVKLAESGSEGSTFLITLPARTDDG